MHPYSGLTPMYWRLWKPWQNRPIQNTGRKNRNIEKEPIDIARKAEWKNNKKELKLGHQTEEKNTVTKEKS